MNDPLQDTADYLGNCVERLNALVSSDDEPTQDEIDQYFLDKKHPDEVNWIKDLADMTEQYDITKP